MIKSMNHVGLSVADLQRSVAFYRDLFGMQLVAQAACEGEKYSAILALKGAKGQAAMLRSGEVQIELFEFVHPLPKPVAADRPVCDHGITHFCLEVNDVDAEYGRLKAAGVAFHCAPIDFGRAKATYGRDPDGNVFELRQGRAASAATAATGPAT